MATKPSVARGRAQVAAARTRYERSWAGEVGRQLKDLDFVNWVTVLGASLLWSAVPLVILLSSFADERVDDDLSRHIGLSRDGAHIVRTLFRGTPAHSAEPILTGFVFSFFGVLAVVGSLQHIYERIFDQEHRGWRDTHRWIIWTAVVIGLLAAEATINGRLRRLTGAALPDLITLVVGTLFFWWTMHFLLGGRVSWRRLARPAITTGAFWVAFGLFSSAYFSSLIVSDSHLYGTIGVVFTLLTWFFLIGAVLVLGAVVGAAWQTHAEAREGVST